MCLNIGDKVRSFDFDSRDLEGPKACYIEGVVEAIGKCDGFPDCERYKIKVSRQVFGGKEYAHLVGQYVFPPKNGVRKLFGGVCNAVQKIEEV